MDIRITKPVKGGVIKAIASKSEAHRLLICAALSSKETFVSCPKRSEDINATAGCLNALGAKITYEQDGFRVVPIYGIGTENQKHKHYTLDCGESGSTLRFLLPVCGALGVRVSFIQAGRLPSRPLSGLYEEMISHGCTLSKPGSSPLTCEGQLKSGTYTIPGNISSQYVSGLLLALPILSGDSVIHVTGVLESRPYVDITLDMLRIFGISITEEDTEEEIGAIFHVPGGLTFHSQQAVRAGGDWSNAAFWLSAGAIGSGCITCTGLNQESKQGDRLITDLLTRFGADITFSGDSVTVSPGRLRGIEIDAGDTPDLVPILSAVASVAEGTTVIRNAKRLRIKESDRLRTVTKVLSALGADVSETDDGLIIKGGKKLTGGETESFGDHRIAMTAAVLSAACSGDVVINGADAVNKSYPGFFSDFADNLGGEWEEI